MEPGERIPLRHSGKVGICNRHEQRAGVCAHTPMHATCKTAPAQFAMPDDGTLGARIKCINIPTFLTHKQKITLLSLPQDSGSADIQIGPVFLRAVAPAANKARHIPSITRQ